MLLCQQLRFLRKSDNTSKISHLGFEILFLQRVTAVPNKSGDNNFTHSFHNSVLRYKLCFVMQIAASSMSLKASKGRSITFGVCFFIPVPANRSGGLYVWGKLKLTFRQINYLEQKDRHKYFFRPMFISFHTSDNRPNDSTVR